MEELSGQPGVGRSVDAVADYGQVDGGEVDADLVCSARFEPDAKERVTAEQFFDVEVSDRLASCLGIKRLPSGVLAISSDRSLDPPSPRLWPASHERAIDTLERPRPHHVLEALVCLLGAGDDEQAGSVPVEPVDDPRAVRFFPAGRAEVEQPLDQRPVRMSRRRMDNHPSRLVHDEQVRVFVRDAQIDLFGLQRGRFGGGEIDLERLAAGQPPAFDRRRPVHTHGAGAD